MRFDGQAFTSDSSRHPRNSAPRWNSNEPMEQSQELRRTEKRDGWMGRAVPSMGARRSGATPLQNLRPREHCGAV